MEVSIIWTAASWVAASASMMRPQTPARRQRTNRLWQVVYGPNAFGRSRHGAPDRKTQKMPLRTRRSFTRGTPRGLRRFVASPQMIEAPHAASRHCEIEEHEAVDDSQLTRVQERKEAPRRVRYEVCEGHVACQNERDRTSEQPEHDEHPADELNHAVDARERHGGHSRRGRNWQAKIFRHPMLHHGSRRRGGTIYWASLPSI